MFASKLSNRFGRLADTRRVSAPWPWVDFWVEILRSGARAWQEWAENNRTNSKLVDLVVKAGIKATLAADLAEQQTIRPGQRQRRKLTRAERERRAASFDPETVLDKALDRVSSDELLAVRSLNDLKPGIAMVAIQAHGGPDLEEVAPTVEDRLRLLGWEGFLVKLPGEPPQAFSRDAWAKLDPASDLAKAATANPALVEEFTGPARHEDGTLVWVDEVDAEGNEIDYGGRPVGDAITAWLLDEMEATEDFRGQIVARAAEDFTPTPAGATAG